MSQGPLPRCSLPFPLNLPFVAMGGGGAGPARDDGSGETLNPSSPSGLLSALAGLGQGLTQGLAIGPAAMARLTLLINHVLCTEPQAMQQLMPHAGKTLVVQWEHWPAWLPLPARAAWEITRPGLLDLLDPVQFPGAPDDTDDSPAPSPIAGDLTVTLDSRAMLQWLAQAPLQASPSRPPMVIQGDGGLAAAVAWLADHLRWDIEDDLARVVGDGPAHLLGRIGRGIAEAARRLIPSQPR